MTNPTVIREYREYETDGIDTANQIKFDLNGTWGFRAVAYRNNDGEIVDWFAVKGKTVLAWWPEFYDEPVWNKSSIYEFSNPLREECGYFTLHEWPDELDTEAEVML